jgi:hypothetical protein
MVALLATADLDDELMSALRVLVTEPADLTSTDAFARTGHPLRPELRRRLLAALDRFGIARAVLALGEGADDATVSTVLRRASQVDRVVEHIEAAGAPVRYRRVRSTITELHSLAVQSGDERLARFLSTDETVLAVMAAAVDVVEAAGVRVDRGEGAAAHLRRAVHWRRYSRGPVGALHRSCGADIARGSLRLLGRSDDRSGSLRRMPWWRPSIGAEFTGCAEPRRGLVTDPWRQAPPADSGAAGADTSTFEGPTNWGPPAPAAVSVRGVLIAPLTNPIVR